MASNVPLTIQATNNQPMMGPSRIVIGNKNYNFPGSGINNYWAMVVDRQGLTVKENFAFKDNSTVPSQLNEYLGNTEFILILTTYQLGVAYLPTGALYEFLKKEGAGEPLARGEQLFEALNCSHLVNFAYTFVAIFGDDGGSSFEGLEAQAPALLTTLQLIPTDIGGKIWYTPTNL